MISRRGASGFTLIELMVSVVIVGLLASIAVPMAELAVQRNKEQDLRLALREIRNAIDAYKQASYDGRVTTDKLASGYPPNLRVLIEGIADLRSPDKSSRIYFLRRIPRDPFADSVGDPESTWGKRDYASSADEPMEGEDVFDVYSQSLLTGLNGIRYRQW